MIQQKKKVILANAAICNGNRGCLALSYCAIYLIDSIFSSQKIEYELYLTDSNVKGSIEKAICIADKKIYFSTCIYPVAYTWKSFLHNIYKWRETVRSWKIFRNADLILDIGQGDSFADIYGRSRFEGIDRIHKTARFFHKPYSLLPQTIGPFKNVRIREKANKSIAKAQWVMARDIQSYNYVTEHVPLQKDIKEYIDIAFFLPFSKRTFDSNYVHVGLNISALLWHGGYSKKNQFDLKSDYPTLMRQIVEFFLSRPEVKLHLVPHVVNHMRNVENDYAIAFDLQKEYGCEKVTLAPLFLNPIDAKDYISGLDFFLGARMHATIAAYSSGVPVVPMAYSRKFNGLFCDTLAYSTMVDLKTMTAEESIQMVMQAYEERKKLKKKIEDSMHAIVEEKKRQLLDDLRKILLA